MKTTFHQFKSTDGLRLPALLFEPKKKTKK